MHKVAEDVDKNNRDATLRHFNEAIDRFDKAMAAFACADLGPENKEAVKSLDAGLNQLEKTIKALEKENYPEASEHYEMAREDLADAVEKLR